MSYVIRSLKVKKKKKEINERILQFVRPKIKLYFSLYPILFDIPSYADVFIYK